MTIDYSIIICSYNPDERILNRCLQSVSLLDVEGFSTEVILVDNNSTNPLSELGFVQDFLKSRQNSKLLYVKEQGVFFARKAGIKASKGSEIVFFDDDNEPQPNYIKVLSGFLADYPNVAAWGPGSIHVDFLDGVPSELEAYSRVAFQERKEQYVSYSNQRFWQSCYPLGTGLCIKKSYMDEYLSLVDQGRFTLSGRTGGNMDSGEDSEMVLYCVSRGAAAGMLPGLELTHMVPGNRTNFTYLKRLAFGTSTCYSLMNLEVFPEFSVPLPKSSFPMKALRRYLKLKIKPDQIKLLNLINHIGLATGDLMALKRPVPAILSYIINQLKLR